MLSTKQHIHIDVADGSTMGAYVARAAGSSTMPGIMVFQEAFGVNAHIRDIADRFAELGYVAIAPDLFHRSGPGFEGSYGDFEKVRPHMAALSIEGLNADIDAAAAWLHADASIDSKRLAAIGFCMGGRVAYLSNARANLAAAISFYGGGIAPDLLPLAAHQHAPILMFWGGADSHIPPEQYRAVADALTEANAVHEQVIFSAADHGFFCDQRPSYHPQASRQAWAMLKEFLAGCGA
jgi:carboxymethylenebutenolidase